jgi:1,4-dihydroxy-2-naphthoyl-CoA synthase
MSQGLRVLVFQGERAAEIGFVNAAYPLADLKREVMALAWEIASKDPDALIACTRTATASRSK